MVKCVTVVCMVFFSILFSGCQSGTSQKNVSADQPRLLNSEAGLRSLRLSVSRKARSATIGYPEDSALKIRQMELAHQERLATIEAEKAKALKTLELEKTRSVEALRQRTAEIEAAGALKLQEEKRKYAALLAARDQKIEALETNASLHRDRTRAEVAGLETKTRQKIAQINGRYRESITLLETKLREKTLWIVVGTLVSLLLLWFLFYRYRRSAEDKARQEERRHEAQLLERRLRHEEVEKVLEIIASDRTDDRVKIELARLLQQGTIDSDHPKLIEHHRDQDKEPEDGPAEA